MPASRLTPRRRNSDSSVEAQTHGPDYLQCAAQIVVHKMRRPCTLSSCQKTRVPGIARELVMETPVPFCKKRGSPEVVCAWRPAKPTIERSLESSTRTPSEK